MDQSRGLEEDISGSKKRAAHQIIFPHNERKPHESALGLILKKQKTKRHAKQAHISKFRKIVQMRKSRQNAKCKVLQIKQSFSRPQMAVRKKTKFFLTPTKKLKLRIACGLEKDVLGSEKREAACSGRKKAESAVVSTWSAHILRFRSILDQSGSCFFCKLRDLPKLCIRPSISTRASTSAASRKPTGLSRSECLPLS